MTTLNTWKVIEPDGYYKNFLEKKSRPDGRRWMESRPIMLKVGSITTAEGSATVRLGNTSVVCGVKAEICTPDLRNPDKGFIVPNVELYPCCSPQFRAGPPGERSILTSQFLRNVLESADVIDLTSLCIVPNKVSWCLYCDVICLDYDGNLTDAALIALIAALENIRLPQVLWDEDKEKVTASLELTEKLTVKAKPVATTFTIISDTIQLIDPTAEDEAEGHGEVTLVLNENGSLCFTHKPGGRLVSPQILESFLEHAKHRGSKVNLALAKAIEQYDNKLCK